jgi:hypothetical protein
MSAGMQVFNRALQPRPTVMPMSTGIMTGSSNRRPAGIIAVVFMTWAPIGVMKDIIGRDVNYRDVLLMLE